MIAEKIRRAASQIQFEWASDAGTGDYLCDTLLLVALWLNSEADRCDQLTRAMPGAAVESDRVADWKLAHALRIAASYLGEK